MRLNRKLFWVYCSIFVSAVLGGAGFVFMKDSLAVFSASWFTFWRFFISAAVLFPFFAKKITLRALKDGFLVGALFCVATLVQLQGIARADAGRSAFINSSSIVLVPLLQAALTRRIPSAKVMAGCFLCLFGVVFLSARKVTGRGDGMAELWVFAGTFLFACQLLTFKWLVQRNDPAVLSFVEFAAVAMTALPAALIQPGAFLGGGTPGWGGVLYAAMLMNIVMLMANNNALLYLPPTNVTVISSTQAIYGAAFGALLLNESFTWQLAVSGSAIMAGVILVIFATVPLKGYNVRET